MTSRPITLRANRRTSRSTPTSIRRRPHQIQVLYANDAWDGTATTDGHDRNVYVSSLSANGQTINGTLATNTANNGTIVDANPA